jgi:hypothetical protein
MRQLVIVVSSIIIFIVLIAISTMSIDAHAQTDSENQNLRELVISLQETVGIHESVIAALKPGDWNKLNAPSSWTVFYDEIAQCRKNGDWIEFQGGYNFSDTPLSYTYPVHIDNFLPSDCRPETWPHAVIYCGYNDPSDNGLVPGVCSVEFSSDGGITIYFPIHQQPLTSMFFEGLRIRSEANKP